MVWWSTTPRDRDALERIIECIEAIDAYVDRVGVDWPTDGMAVDAIAKRVEEIGEVAKRVTPEIPTTMPDVTGGGSKECARSSPMTTTTSIPRSSRGWFETIFLVSALRLPGG
jgi:hypothetical protein